MNKVSMKLASVTSLDEICSILFHTWPVVAMSQELLIQFSVPLILIAFPCMDFSHDFLGSCQGQVAKQFSKETSMKQNPTIHKELCQKPFQVMCIFWRLQPYTFGKIFHVREVSILDTTSTEELFTLVIDLLTRYTLLLEFSSLSRHVQPK